VEPLIEAIAAGEVVADPETESHLADCASCAAALALARRIESALAGRPQPDVPLEFARDVAARIRRDRWREEERIDLAFNVSLGVAACLVVFGIAAAFNLSGLGVVLAATSSLLTQGITTAGSRLAVSPGILGAIVLLVSVCGAAWWWAERRYSW
jgi:anti-sigma factor RsiW